MPYTLDMASKSFRTKLLPLLSPAELATIKKLSTPIKVQDFLDHFPANFSKIGDSVKSPRWILQHKRAHCIEAAVLAAVALAYHGRPALLMDLRATDDDEDHVIALFKEHGYWGAISKTNHPQLRWRDAVYKTPRELALSYFHEYFLFDATHFAKKVSKSKLGKKTMREYSKPFDITKFDPKHMWSVTSLDWLAEKLDGSPHLPILSKRAVQNLRKASLLEIKSANLREWQK